MNTITVILANAKAFWKNELEADSEAINFTGAGVDKFWEWRRGSELRSVAIQEKLEAEH